MNRAPFLRRPWRATLIRSPGTFTSPAKARAGPNSKRFGGRRISWYGPTPTRQRASPMPNAKLIAALAAAGLSLAGCHKQPQAQDQNMSLESGVPSNEVLANADIETLPADESSATCSDPAP